DTDQTHAGLGLEANLKRLLDGAGKALAGEARLIRGGFRSSADGERAHSRPVESNLQLLRLRHATERAAVASLQLDSEDILPVEREVVPDSEASPRAERQVLTHTVALQQQGRDPIRLDDRADRHVAGRQASDLSRRQ